MAGQNPADYDYFLPEISHEYFKDDKELDYDLLLKELERTSVAPAKELIFEANKPPAWPWWLYWHPRFHSVIPELDLRADCDLIKPFSNNLNLTGLNDVSP